MATGKASRERRKAQESRATPGYTPGSLAWYFHRWPGGVEDVVLCVQEHAMSLADDDPNLKLATAFVEAWNATPEHDLDLLDVICKQVKLRPADLFAMVAARAYELRDRGVELLRAVMEVPLLATSYERGLDGERGFKDRNAILQAAGHHFAPKGGIVIDQRSQTVNVERGLPDFTDEPPDASATVHRLHEALQQPRSLAPVPIAVEISQQEATHADADHNDDSGPVRNG